VAYLFLLIAVVAEVIATSSLKASDQFSKLGPSLVVIAGYAVAFFLLSIVVKTIPVGITYAVWAGLGIVLVAIVSSIQMKQMPDLAAVVGMALIVAGVVIVNLLSKSVSH
jgi:small multidrug resistance pump